MSENLKVFDYKNNKIRTVKLDGKPWFILKDICGVLGMDTSQLKKVADRLEDDEKARTQITTPGGVQESWVVNESGLYNIVLRSDKPEAKPFRKWVTSEVLPSIRENGAYITPAKLNELLCRPESVIEMLTTLSEEQKKNAELTAKNKKLAKENEYMAPRADYCDNVLKSTTVTYLPTDIAKEYGWSAVKLNKVLHELKIIQKVGKNWHLYSHLDGQGLVEYKETEYYDHIHGMMNSSSTMYWTERGKAYIYNRLKKLGFFPRNEASRKVKEDK